MGGFQRSQIPLQATMVTKGISEADEFQPDTGGWVVPRQQLKELRVMSFCYR